MAVSKISAAAVTIIATATPVFESAPEFPPVVPEPDPVPLPVLVVPLYVELLYAPEPYTLAITGL